MSRPHPFPGCNFLVDCGAPIIGFAEVDGLSTEIETVNYREGAYPAQSPIKIPSLSKVSDVTLRRGVVADPSLYQWFDAQRNGTDSPRDVVVTLLDGSHNPVLRWKLFSCRPKRIGWSKLGANSGEIATEEFVLSCERLVLDVS